MQAPSLATWFADAVRAEISAIEKKGGGQRFELYSGHRLTAEESQYAVYRFALADDTLLPEDASGTIDVNGGQYKATVVSQETNQIDIQIAGAESLGSFIARGLLRVDDLGLLRKLADALDAVSRGTRCISPLATSIFHPKLNGIYKTTLPGMPSLDRVEQEQRTVIEQACASEITFVWGPPGTGKTHMIAHLIATLVARGERVLMASHTHAAVDQAIYEIVKTPGSGTSGCGPLAHSMVHCDGQIVRIGHVTNPKVPESVQLEHIVAGRAEKIQSEIGEMERRIASSSSSLAPLQAKLCEWDRLGEIRRRLESAKGHLNEASVLAENTHSDVKRAASHIAECERQFEVAGRAWFFRARRVEQANRSLLAAKNADLSASDAAEHAARLYREAEVVVSSLNLKEATQANICAGLPAAESLKAQIAPLDAELKDLLQRLTELRSRIDAMEKNVISEARVVAATLTKCYVGDQLEGQTFDAVIVDEISMALPPLLFIAGGRALQRVILVGDFKQLPPIVRSDSEIAALRLGQDAFHLARVVVVDKEDHKPVKHSALARLRTQRRMLPAIADAARQISYQEGLDDHEDVKTRVPPLWLRFLPENPLVVIDTADLHCWCGRRAGSLSRFNLYSSQISVELAAMAAAKIGKPDDDDPKPIGIVTPYAAQSRLLRRLIEALELEPWVRVGTVHTFQGGEADLIIFDSVLDEPYWTARLCNPNETKEVKRDLNVALTRAKSKFVLVGSSEWLNRHARPTSGLGQLWHYMKEHGDLRAAHELVEAGFAKRVATDHPRAYNIPKEPTNAILHRIFDEKTFFPQFADDLNKASKSIFGLVPFFGEYRWPTVEPLIRAAIERGVEVTLVTPPPAEAENGAYVEKAVRSLRELGAVVVAATGLHGKDIVIDGRIHYTGSLNWASHRGRAEIMHRTDNADYAQMVLEHLQAKHIRTASGQGLHPRVCPHCHGPTQVVNQSQRMAPWDKQPIKLGCANYHSTGCRYLVDIDQRPPFTDIPRCSADGRTKYRRARRGRGEVWECPKHPRDCERFKVVPGDP